LATACCHDIDDHDDHDDIIDHRDGGHHDFVEVNSVPVTGDLQAETRNAALPAAP